MKEVNEHLSSLADFVNDNNLFFPSSVRDSGGIRVVRELRGRFLGDRRNRISTTVDAIERCLLDPTVQKILRVNRPELTDYSELLGLRRGRVYGIEYRLMGPTGSHKDLMVGALIVAQVMARALPREGIDTLTDAGFFNSALATKFYSAHFGLKGTYFIQDSTPLNLLDDLQDENFEVVRVPVPVPESGIDKKNETYLALLRRFHKDPNFLTRARHLGHAEIGFFAVMPYGRMLARLLAEKGIRPSAMVTSVGAGTTMVGIGEQLHDQLGLELIVGEYAGLTPVRMKVPDHYAGEIVDNTRTDVAILEHAAKKGYDIGLTSAGGLALASYIAETEDKTVITPIFEKFRDYTRDARKVISRALELNPFIPEDFWLKVGRVYSLH